MADQNLVYYALLFGVVLAYPIFRLVAKQLRQFSGTPGQGKTIVGDDGCKGEGAVYTRADVAKHNTQDDLWVGIAAATQRRRRRRRRILLLRCFALRSTHAHDFFVHFSRRERLCGMTRRAALYKPHGACPVRARSLTARWLLKIRCTT